MTPPPAADRTAPGRARHLAAVVSGCHLCPGTVPALPFPAVTLVTVLGERAVLLCGSCHAGRPGRDGGALTDADFAWRLGGPVSSDPVPLAPVDVPADPPCFFSVPVAVVVCLLCSGTSRPVPVSAPVTKIRSDGAYHLAAAHPGANPATALDVRYGEVAGDVTADTDPAELERVLSSFASTF